MKPTAIVYTSKTGHTRQYARLLGEQICLPFYSLEEASSQLSRDSSVIYLGWIHASHVKGYSKAARLYSISAICGVGLCDTGTLISEVRKATAIPDDITMVQGEQRILMKQDARQVHKTKHSRSQVARRWLLFWTLLIVNGLTNLTAAVLILLRRKSGVILGGWFGVTLMLWICIQFIIFPFNFMSTSYFIFGFCQATAGYMAWVFGKQEAFRVEPSEYPNIGTDHTRLVVFFSRMGYVKKQAYEAASRTGAQVYEIKAAERTEGTAGFWWCGRFAMHRWAMPIQPVALDLTAYDHVTICTPIWVFSLASPVREFCRQAAGKIKAVEYVLVHHTKGNYESVVEEMDRLLGIVHKSSVSVQCRKGSFELLN